ncbi:MAG TPA: serine protease [Candidatus Binatia bacterium]|jgi:hypothetical protein|nr:serine protease [Candidatus Binatia bacterium]
MSAPAQSPDVPIFKQGRMESQEQAKIESASKNLFTAGDALKLAEVKEQLKRTSCQLDLPAPKTARLTAREICASARNGHLRVGWAYFCNKCEDWHINLAGGYSLTTNGAVATCYHVVQPVHEIRDGCLVAADEAGNVFPVKEILAANRYSDACIVQVEGSGFKPLPLNTNAQPGDAVYCYSDPLDHRGYFSDGIVNRFYQFPGRRPFSAPRSAGFAPMRLNVSTDWAPGSSGSAVLDEYANVIGHVSTIATVSEEEDLDAGVVRFPGPTMIVFHEAVAARDVLLLIKPPK